MDTYVTIKLWEINKLSESQCFNSAFAEIDSIEDLSSRFKPKSIVTELNRTGRCYSKELAYLISQLLKVSKLSSGAFDPTIAPLLKLWGFYDSTDTQRKLPDTSDLKKTMQLVDYRNITIRGDSIFTQSVELDLSGAAKGYAVDKAVKTLQNLGVTTGLIDAGGDIRCFGKKREGWTIGIKHPYQQDLLGIITIVEGAVATSGDYENFIEIDGVRYHHLINPATGYPARKAVSATVIAKNALEADAWATALFIMAADGINLLDSIDGLEGMLVLKDTTVLTTKGFPEIKKP